MKDKSGKVSGNLNVEHIDFIQIPSFVDYLKSGWEIGLAVAIDYTASNIDPRDPQSLHFLGQFNQYE